VLNYRLRLNFGSEDMRRLSFQVDAHIVIGIRSPYSHGGERTCISKFSGGFSESESDISFISSGRPSTDRSSSVAFDYSDSGPPRFSTSSEHSFASLPFKPKWTDLSNLNDFSSVSDESCRTSCSWSSQNLVSILWMVLGLFYWTRENFSLRK